MSKISAGGGGFQRTESRFLKIHTGRLGGDSLENHHERRFKLCGYDLELGITTVIEAQVDEPGEVVLSARLFGDIVRRLPDETVTILVDEK